MALRLINPRRKPLLFAHRAFSSSNRPFPPPPYPPPANGPDAARPPSSPPHPNTGAPRNPVPPFRDIRERLKSSPTPPPPPDNGPDAARAPSSPPPPNTGGPLDPAHSLFRDIRERLKSSPTQPPPRRIPTNPLPVLPIADVRRALDSFRTNPEGGGVGALSPSAPGATPSFQDLLVKNRPALGPNDGQRTPGLLESIGAKIRNLQPAQRSPRPPAPFISPSPSTRIKWDQEERKAGKEEEKDSGMFSRTYTYEDLGKRLGELRPAGAAKDGKEWFSLEELQGRIARMAKLEKEEEKHRLGELGVQFSQVRESIQELTTKQATMPKTGYMSLPPLMGIISGKPKPGYMSLPPQEELLERYFHPDHMSSEEKMKLELQRVRDEFKMSESDCGSARVQIAQLTVKIKHLSAVLHKKDKHSRKGLQDMVQRRKKYLKYLRRTDWDSYCLVLSKLGLRDVPEYKAPDYKSKTATKAKSKKSKSKSKKRKMKA